MRQDRCHCQPPLYVIRIGDPAVKVEGIIQLTNESLAEALQAVLEDALTQAKGLIGAATGKELPTSGNEVTLTQEPGSYCQQCQASLN